MTKSNTNSKKGFTIIEVVLVLAIAGLIFLMVFVALPALQRSQRDTQRRDDMARLITSIQNYQAGNKNKIPTKVTGSGNFTHDGRFYKGYLLTEGDTFADRSTGNDYEFLEGRCVSSSDCVNRSADKDSFPDNYATGVITYYTDAVCNGPDPEYKRGENRIAFTIKLEGAGTYCTNN